MNKLRTVFGLLILLAGALVVYYLLKPKPTETSEESAGQVVTEVSVHVGKITRATLHGYVLSYGTVQLAVGSSSTPAARVSITAPSAGRISEVACVEGQMVSQGDTLFRLDSRIAEAAVRQAEQAVELADKDFARQKELMQSQGTSEKLLQQAQYRLAAAKNDLTKARTELSLLQVAAPISGMIVRVPARPGETVNMSDTLAELIDPNRLTVEFRVPSEQMSLLKIGQKVEIETSDRTVGPNGQTPAVSAELTFVDSMVDPQSDTVLARASVPASALFRPGRFVKVRVIYLEKSNCLVVPEESLVTTPEGQTVIAVVEDDKAFQKAVQTGLRENGLVEVQAEGIHEGMQIVTVGAYGLPSETKIRIVGE
jgi:membrane fusion protein (multidrug efflux system)